MNPLLQRAKDEVAQRHSYQDWDNLQWVYGYDTKKLSIYLDEVAELYAKYSREEEAEKLKSALRDCVSFIKGDIAYDDEKSGFVTGFIPQCVTDAKNLLNP